MARDRYDDYGYETTLRCERALLTMIGDIGPWSQRVVLVGGLAPRYIAGSLPLGASPHAGTTDVDLVLEFAVGDSAETYQTLQANLKKSGFMQVEPSYRWCRRVEGRTVSVEFLCETDQVEFGRIYRPKQGAGSRFGAFNVLGAQLVSRDFVETSLEGERLDVGGWSKVTVRVAGLLAYIVLKVLAFQDRHDNKDAYDLVYTLVNFPDGGPSGAGRAARKSPVREEPLTLGALELLEQRFTTINHDGPKAYANFLASPGDADAMDRLRNEAVAAVRAFLTATRIR